MVFADLEICICPTAPKIHPVRTMKIPTSRSQRGFTLVELLVVIAIIAVLAAAGFAAGNAAIQKARKVTALASATAIETAVTNFFTEYGSMPYEGEEDTTVETDSADGKKLLTVLMGFEGTGTSVLNTRGVKFLSVREGKKRKVEGEERGINGLIYSTDGKSVEGLFDPWGGGYKIRLDLGYNDQLDVQPKGAGAQKKTLNGRRVAVWSDGADGVGSKTGKVADDVITW